MQSVSHGNQDTFSSRAGPLRFVDFFAGVGLVEVALEPPWRCVWANDIDPKKKDIYDANFPLRNRYLLADISNVGVEDLPADIDMAWASFPCQDLSLAGWRRGLHAERSGVFWSFHRLMKQLRELGKAPPLIVIENVVGLLYGRNFLGLCEALHDLDMSFGALVMDAKHFVPQSRPRVFFVAVDSRINIDAFVRTTPDDVDMWTSPALRVSVDTLPSYLRERWQWWRVAPHEPTSLDLSALIESHPPDVKWNTSDQTQRLIEMMTDSNLAKVRSAVSSPDRSIGFLYRRTRSGQQRAEVRFDGVAGCLRTPNGGSSRQTVVVVENGEIRTRLLSSREAARLMGVPDTFSLPGGYNDAYKAMGDGVAVPVVKWLSDQLLIPLALAARIKQTTANHHHDDCDIRSAWDPAEFHLGAALS